MAGEALQVVDALELLRLGVVHHIGEAAEIGCAVHRDVDEAAPRVLDLRVFQLREGVRHALLHAVGEIRRRRGAVADPAAEQQAMVGGGAEVIEHEVAVAHRRLRRD